MKTNLMGGISESSDINISYTIPCGKILSLSAMANQTLAYAYREFAGRHKGLPEATQWYKQKSGYQKVHFHYRPSDTLTLIEENLLF